LQSRKIIIMKKICIVLLWTFPLFFAACNGSDDSNSDTGETTEATKTAPAQGETLYPSIPLDTLTMLYNQCDYIDYVFYYTNFSVNQSDQANIRSALSHIAEEPALVHPNCKPIGRIFYQVEGENRAQADLYFTEGCIYYLFYDDGKPAYANRMMPAGINFINSLLTRVQSTGQ
jgi:hypothetical protein